MGMSNDFEHAVSVKELQSNPVISRALTRENQLVALAPWTPNFSDAPLATAHMTDR